MALVERNDRPEWRKAVTEAIRVFEADTLRQEYEPQEDGSFVVSPENAREILATFIKRARKQLLIYDPKVADLQMIRLINQRIKAGVDVRIIGKVSKRGANMSVQKLPGFRLHVRACAIQPAIERERSVAVDA